MWRMWEKRAISRRSEKTSRGARNRDFLFILSPLAAGRTGCDMKFMGEIVVVPGNILPSSYC